MRDHRLTVPDSRDNALRRFVGTALLCFSMGILSPVFPAVYYAVKRPTDFQPVITALRTTTNGKGKLLWTVQVGGVSAHSLGIGWRSTYGGFNVDDALSQRHFAQLTSGALASLSSATYLARFSDSAVPGVLAIFRDVDVSGLISYDSAVIGLGPVKSYFKQAVAFSLLGAAFFEVVRILTKRRKLRVAVAERP